MKKAKSTKTKGVEVKDLNPDHSGERSRIRRVHGQTKAIERMISERRYCPEIVLQIRAATAALKSLESAILERHIAHCVNDAIKGKNKEDAQRKIDELIQLFKKS